MITVSFSGLGMYDNCPSSFQRKYVTKEPVERPDEAGANSKRARGTMRHNQIDRYLQGDEGVLHADIMYYQGLFETIRDHKGIPECKFAFDKDWEPVGFTSDDAMVRGILDCVVYHEDDNIVEVYEWKTGRQYPDHEQQRFLYGLAGMLLYPMAERCIISTVYLDEKKVKTSETARGLVPGTQWMWQRRVNRVQPPQPYPIRPNWKCKFCDYAVDNGGKCFAGAK